MCCRVARRKSPFWTAVQCMFFRLLDHRLKLFWKDSRRNHPGRLISSHEKLILAENYPCIYGPNEKLWLVRCQLFKFTYYVSSCPDFVQGRVRDLPKKDRNVSHHQKRKGKDDLLNLRVSGTSPSSACLGGRGGWVVMPRIRRWRRLQVAHAKTKIIQEVY